MKIYLVLLLWLLLSACASNTGEVSVFSVNSNKRLDSPLVAASELHSKNGIVYKTNEEHATNNDDTFAIYLTDSYLRYLPDLGGVNEVIIIVEFNEVVTGTASDTVTKILGPYDSVADATKAPFFHKLLYGPKRMESDILSMSLKIYEYDLEENGNVGSLIDFIATAGEALSLANPITAQEIEVAKELAKSVTNTNDNDLILQLDVDFVAGNSLYNHAGNQHLNVLPLKAGELVLIKREACALGQCYDYFSQDEGVRNTVGYVADVALSPITALITGLTDTPASSSLTDIKPLDFKVDDAGLAYNPAETKTDKKYEPFRKKTWLRLSILKGGDPSLWDKRKLLYPIEADITKLLKKSGGIQSSNLLAPIAALSSVKKQLEDLDQGGIRIVSEHAQNNVQYVLSGTASAAICLDIPARFKLTSTAPSYAGKPQTELTAPVKYKCFNIVPPPPPAGGAATFSKGTNYFQINYTENDVLKSYIAAIKVIDALSLTNTSACKLPNGEIRLSTQLNHREGILGIETSGLVSTPSIDNNILSHIIKSDKEEASIKTVFDPKLIDFSGVTKPYKNCN